MAARPKIAVPTIEKVHASLGKMVPELWRKAADKLHETRDVQALKAEQDRVWSDRLRSDLMTLRAANDNGPNLPPPARQVPKSSGKALMVVIEVLGWLDIRREEPEDVNARLAALDDAAFAAVCRAIRASTEARGDLGEMLLRDRAAWEFVAKVALGEYVPERDDPPAPPKAPDPIDQLPEADREAVLAARRERAEKVAAEAKAAEGK